MKVWLYTFISVILISLISLVGIFTLSLNKARLRKLSLFFVSLAVGGLFGDAFIHLLPEAFEKLGINIATSLYIVLGILVFFVLEKFLRWRHCHISVSEEHPHPVVAMNLIGDAVHNLMDGVIIGASYIVSIPIGVTTTLAVILHEVPQEIGDFGVLVHGGLSIKKALFYNFLCALTGVVGATISLMIGPIVQQYTLSLLPITAGGFLYIAGSDLIPELQHDVNLSTSLWQFTFMILGVGIMVLLAFVK